VLLEENNVPDGAAEAGHQALNGFVTTTLGDFVTGINLIEFSTAVQNRVNGGATKEQALQDELKLRVEAVQKKIEDGASDVVETAIRQNMNLPESIWAVIDKDEVMGKAFHTFTTDELIRIHDFEVENSDHMCENETLPEAGKWAYNLHSYVKAKVKWQALQSQLPADHDIQIQGIKKGYSRDNGHYYISSVGGVFNGASWWMERSAACSMIRRGEKAFYILGANGVRTPVLVESGESYWDYLTTPGDSDPANNLLNLPKLATLPGFTMSTLVVDPFA
jgi:hypothetical protein